MEHGTLLTTTTAGLVLGTVCMLLSSLHCQACLKGLMDEDLCRTLDIQHTGTPRGVDPNCIQIVLTDIRNKVESTCYEPLVHYNITIKSSCKTVKGLLLVQDTERSRGTFPYTTRTIKLPDSLTAGPCREDAVSHRCLTLDEKWKCNLGKYLGIPYLSPGGRDDVIRFRYSIVFESLLFLEDKAVEFPPCLLDTREEVTTEAPAPPSPVCDVTAFQKKETTQTVSRPCTNSPKYTSNEERTITENGTTENGTITENGTAYTCTVDGEEVKKKNCSSGCLREGKQLCCRVEVNRLRNRTFNCSPKDSSGPNITKVFEVVYQKKCECFVCEDVCPASPVENSPELEHTTEMESNDVEFSHSTPSSETEAGSSKDNSSEGNDPQIESPGDESDLNSAY